MLIVIMMSVVMLSVVAPTQHHVASSLFHKTFYYCKYL